jgi:hypothetical protein
MGGAGPIPFGEIDRYAERYGIRDFDGFRRMIRSMERVLREREREPKG